MIEILILIALYVLGVYVCRKAMLKNEDLCFGDFFDVIICFTPVFNYAWVCVMLVATIDIGDKLDNLADKFFGRK